MEDFEGKVAVVTGAASGIGRGLAQRFAEEGMRVVLADVEADALDAAVAELRDAGHEVRGEQVDVSSQPSVDALAQAAFEAWGGVHVVCNNAGVAAVNDWGSLHPEGGVPMWDLTLDDWRWTYGVNFWGVVHGIRAFTPLLLEQGEPAHIVNTGSVQSFQGGTSLVAYSSTKFAVGRITEALQMQLSELGSPVRAHLAERNRPTALPRRRGDSQLPRRAQPPDRTAQPRSGSGRPGARGRLRASARRDRREHGTQHAALGRRGGSGRGAARGALLHLLARDRLRRADSRAHGADHRARGAPSLILVLKSAIVRP